MYYFTIIKSYRDMSEQSYNKHTQDSDIKENNII